MTTPLLAGPTGPVVMQASPLGTPILIPLGFPAGTVQTFAAIPVPGYEAADRAQLLVDGAFGATAGILFQIAFNAPGLADVTITNCSSGPVGPATVNAIALLWKTSNLVG